MPNETSHRPLSTTVAALLLIAGCGRTLPLDDLPSDGGTDTARDTGFDSSVDSSRDTSVDTLPPSCRTNLDCDDGFFCNGVEQCVGGRCARSMDVFCDDGDPCTSDFCDERSRSCVFEPDRVDADGDGFPAAMCGGDDCDDTRPDVNPAMRELCDDGVDNDCNFAVDCGDDACRFSPVCMCRPEPERCDNGIDDDCNGLVDCMDPICRGFPGCGCMPAPEFCANGIDDDCNGLIDCMDPICFSDPACCMPAPEDCSNMVDDDCDGRVDCADFDCRSTPDCTATCPDGDLGSRVGPRVATGSTVGRLSRLTASCAGSAASPEFAYSWRAPFTGRFSIDTIGSDYDTALHVHTSGCFGPEIACDDDSGPGVQSRVLLSLRGGQEVVIVVDGFGMGSVGNYVLNINPAATEVGNCTDGIDNDRDGLTDCRDPDCGSDPACMRTCPEMDIGRAIGFGVARGSTRGQGDDLTPSCAMSASPDVGIAWTAPRTARYRFDTRGSSFDTVLSLRDGSCMGPEIACDNDAIAPASRITRSVVAGTRLVIVVDGNGFTAGDFQLNIRAFEAPFCGDMIDNDSDGNTDCADSECAGRPECCVPMPEICDDGVDQDCDGLIDCADPNCAGSLACCMPLPEDCSNMRDDDCDGLIDCVDPDCSTDPVC